MSPRVAYTNGTVTACGQLIPAIRWPSGTVNVQDPDSHAWGTADRVLADTFTPDPDPG